MGKHIHSIVCCVFHLHLTDIERHKYRNGFRGHCAEIVKFSLIAKRQAVCHTVFLLPSHFALDTARTLEGAFDNFNALVKLVKGICFYKDLRVHHKKLLILDGDLIEYAYHCITLIFYSLRHL